MSWSLRKKKEGIFVPFILPKENLFLNLCFIPMYGILNTLENILILLEMLLVFKIVESLQCILKKTNHFLRKILLQLIKVTPLANHKIF